MAMFNNIIFTDKDIQTVSDVSDLIDKQLNHIMERIGGLAFQDSPEDDKHRTKLIAQKDILISLKTAINLNKIN